MMFEVLSGAECISSVYPDIQNWQLADLQSLSGIADGSDEFAIRVFKALSPCKFRDESDDVEKSMDDEK